MRYPGIYLPCWLRSLTMHISASETFVFGLSALLIAALHWICLTRQATNSGLLKRNAGKPELGAGQAGGPEPAGDRPQSIECGKHRGRAELGAEAIRIGDHEVDLAFASAVQLAEQHPARKQRAALNTRIRFLESRLQSVQEQAGRLTNSPPIPARTMPTPSSSNWR